MTLREKEQQLLKKWWAKYGGNPLFCFDGLHIVGEARKISGAWRMDESGCPGKNELAWKDAKVRCLFLTKDHNLNGDEEGVDLRMETGYNNCTDQLYHQFYARYLMLLYGLCHINLASGDYPPFEDARNQDNYWDYFMEAPVVRINAKKIGGNQRCPESLLRRYIEKDLIWIKEQIGLYNANIIVICDGAESDKNPMLYLVREMYPDLKNTILEGKEDPWVMYSAKHKVVVLWEWHMSYGIAYAEYYDAVRHLSEAIRSKQVIL